MQEKEIDLNAVVDAVIKESKKEEILYRISGIQSLGTILSSLEIDKFDEVHDIVQSILTKLGKKDEDEDATSEEIAKKRENVIKLKEAVYETLGKAWPEHSKNTQEKYREMFVEHCVECLPSVTRPVQVAVITALNCFVDKLILLKEASLSKQEEDSLAKIVEKILEALQFTLGMLPNSFGSTLNRFFIAAISKHTKLRKESLNIIYTLGKKLKGKRVMECCHCDTFEYFIEKEREVLYTKVANVFNTVLPEIEKDNQPEIKSRVTDTKNLLKND